MRTSQLEQLLSERTSEGRKESTGEFTLAVGQARKKLVTHQLEQSGAFLQKILQGLVGYEPDSIEIRLGRQDVVFSVEPPPPLADKLRSALLNPLDQDPRVRDIAVGLGSCFEQGYGKVEVIQHTPEGGLLLELAESLVEEEFHSDLKRSVLFLRLTRKAPANLWRRFLGPKEMAAEHFSLTQGFCYCAVPVRLDGRLLANPELGSKRGKRDGEFMQRNFHIAERFVEEDGSPAHSLASPSRDSRRAYVLQEGELPRTLTRLSLKRTEFILEHFERREEAANAFLLQLCGEGAGCRALFAIQYELMGNESFVSFVQRGLIVEIVKLDLGCPGVVAVCSVGDLDTDLSLFRLRRDEKFEALVRWLRGQVRAMVEDFHAVRAAGYFPMVNDELNVRLTRLPEYWVTEKPT